MRLRTKWVPLAVAAATMTACAVGSELDPQPFSPAKDDAGALKDSSTPAIEIGLADGGFTFDTGSPDTTIAVDSNADETVASDAGDPDTSLDDTGVDEAAIEVGPDDASPEDTGTVDPDTGTPDTGDPDTGILDTGDPDTGTPDTGDPDTGTADTGDPDTGTPDTGAPDTGTPDTGPADTGVADVAPEAPPPGPPTVAFDTANNLSIAFSKISDVCNGQPFSVTYTAPAGLASMQWKFFTPDASKASAPMNGTCTGAAAYGYFVDPAKYAGNTGGTMQENVAISGIYSGSAGSGRWWWCEPPGNAPNAFVSSPPAPGTVGLQTLSNYCNAKTTPSPSDLGSRWRLEVTVTDNAGKTAVANLYFWVHS
jgi:hypothetical protein